jgi:hypothetical protein
LAKSYQTFIAEATQKAVAEFAPHQKAVGLLMPKIVAANKGEKVVFTAEEQATLKNAAAAAKKFQNASGLFTPKNLSALATQINNAKGIQAAANKYAKSDAEKIAQKMANGTLIQKHQGGVQSEPMDTPEQEEMIFHLAMKHWAISASAEIYKAVVALVEKPEEKNLTTSVLSEIGDRLKSIVLGAAKDSIDLGVKVFDWFSQDIATKNNLTVSALAKSWENRLILFANDKTEHKRMWQVYVAKSPNSTEATRSRLFGTWTDTSYPPFLPTITTIKMAFINSFFMTLEDDSNWDDINGFQNAGYIQISVRYRLKNGVISYALFGKPSFNDVPANLVKQIKEIMPNTRIVQTPFNIEVYLYPEQQAWEEVLTDLADNGYDTAFRNDGMWRIIPNANNAEVASELLLNLVRSDFFINLSINDITG